MPAMTAHEKMVGVTTKRTRILIVQYSGDYLAAYERLQQQNGETYYGHGYVLEQATSLGALYGEATILCCRSPRQYMTRLPEGLNLIAADANPKWKRTAILKHVRQYNPTHLVVLGPLTSVLQWGTKNGRRTLAIFADSFDTPLLRRLYRYGRLATLLNTSGVEWIANHGMNACRSLERIGVKPDKIIPWDYPQTRRPSDIAPKTIVKTERSLTVLFVGALTWAKGLGDVIWAVRYLTDRGFPFRLQIVGEGDRDCFQKLTQRLKLMGSVDFLGSVSNDTVLELMRKATIVVIPSRREYPEGMPLTIYEALCSRTPIVASDHPMFRGHLRDGETAIVYPAGNARTMARKIEDLLSNPSLYALLSSACQTTWEGLQIPVKWGDLLHRWVRNTKSDREWLKENSLASDTTAAFMGTS